MSKKHVSLWSNATTSIDKRWQVFKEKIDVARNNGFANTAIIHITEDEDIILDGNHRLSLAYYFGVEKIYCNKHKKSKRWLNSIKNKMKLYTDEEMNKIDVMAAKILKE